MSITAYGNRESLDGMNMIRGTTPTFILTVEGVDLLEAKNVYATFVQKNNKLTKTGQDIEVSSNQVEVYFNQEESLRFSTGAIMIQLNWTYENGSRACTDIVSTDVGKNLEEGVLA